MPRKTPTAKRPPARKATVIKTAIPKATARKAAATSGSAVEPSQRNEYQPVKTRRIFEEICDAIRKKLVSGELKPGDRLPAERELSEMLNVSRTALREAIRSLEIVGIVELRKGSKGGAFITDTGANQVTRTFRDMLDFGRVSLATLLEARLLVMDSVVRCACERATAKDIEKLRQNITETIELTKRERYEERTMKAVEFSTILADVTGNQVMAAILEAMASVIRGFIVIAGPPAHDPIISSRRRLIDQIAARDADGACETMRSYLLALNEHLLHTEKMLQRASRAKQRIA